MTKSTPAQIMRKALEELATGIKHREVMVRIAKNSIAAADAAALTAAAEVGQQKQSSIGPHYLPPLELDDATIERCACVALEQRCERNTPWDSACVAIAAAIRALKDKP